MNLDLLRVVSIAGIFHDIGKFAERAGDVDSVDKDFVHQEYRYGHAYHTEVVLDAFFGERANWSPRDFPGISVLNLAARHHKPRNTYELLITEGDRIASGHERMRSDDAAEFDVGGFERKRKVPLVNILSRVRLQGKPDTAFEEDWRYKLRTITSLFSHDGLADIFPLKSSHYPALMVQEDYKKHWEQFKGCVTGERNSNRLDLFENFDTLYEILRNFMWCLPASTRKEELPDVSLFEHSKATAALSSCLYLYHSHENGIIEDSDEAWKDITDRESGRFLLFGGDISGIQKFVYQISSKGAYKTLKGRSFLIQLLSEILAKNFVNEFGLSFPNILYASGGKFYLLLPNILTVKTRLDELTSKLNEWLFYKFDGDLYVRTAHEVLSAKDLTRQSGETLYDKWDKLTRKLVYEDRKRHQNLSAAQYDLLFGVDEIKPASCEVCHCSIKSGNQCNTCKNMKEMGRLLGTASYILVADNEEEVEALDCVFDIEDVFSKDTYVWILSEQDLPTSVKKGFHLYCINRESIETLPLGFSYPERVNSSLMILGSNHKFDRTFEKIAAMSNGIERIGILRMDVDDLGKVFSQGLKGYKHDQFSDARFYSLGRITTLSFQLHLFFGAIVPQLINSDKSFVGRVTVVYSGGDDLFLLGAWDAMPVVARKIRRKFEHFTCHNKCFGLSGGIVITRGKFPIYKSAEMAGEAEARAKNNEYKLPVGHWRKKNSLVFFDVPMSWEEFEEIYQIYREVLPFFLDRKFNPLLSRLRHISFLFENDRLLFERKREYSISDIERKLMGEKWRWRMIYGLSRFTERYSEAGPIVGKLQAFATGRMNSSNKHGIEFLPLLTRWLELRTRGQKD